MADVTDGTSNTYLIGEKYISADAYLTGGNGGDDQGIYIGDDADIRRWTHEPPLQDSKRIANKEVFGSIHPGVCLFVCCDGAVHAISFEIDGQVHRMLGNRYDGNPVAVP